MAIAFCIYRLNAISLPPAFNTEVIAITAVVLCQTTITRGGDGVSEARFAMSKSGAFRKTEGRNDAATDTIYDRIYERVCALLTEDRITELRNTLRSTMNHEDITSFCKDHSKLSLISYDPHSSGRGPMRAFRSSVFCVRLLAFVESDSTDTDVRRVQITAEIWDGQRTESRALVDWANPEISDACA